MAAKNRRTRPLNGHFSSQCVVVSGTHLLGESLGSLWHAWMTRDFTILTLVTEREKKRENSAISRGNDDSRFFLGGCAMK